ARGGQISADVCSECHPFYTGKQKILDVGGRVEKWEKRFGKSAGIASTGATPANQG
ncbi:MAG: large subunit ribosomal protein, partial [Frankiaceae bacterium]|nr:large subunit ribosomal protein [Frankiaceae bacterium]